MVLRKTVCLKHLGGGRGGELGAGRFFANRKVTAERIVASWSDRTVSAVTGRHVLAIQDTTEVSIATRAGRRRGLGQCGHGNGYGVLAHVMLAVDADSGACLGLVGGKVWNREGLVKTPVRERALADREFAAGSRRRKRRDRCWPMPPWSRWSPIVRAISTQPGRGSRETDSTS